MEFCAGAIVNHENSLLCHALMCVLQCVCDNAARVYAVYVVLCLLPFSISVCGDSPLDKNPSMGGKMDLRDSLSHHGSGECAQSAVYDFCAT